MSWTSITVAAFRWITFRLLRRGSRWGAPLYTFTFEYAQVQHLQAIEPNGTWRGPRTDFKQWMDSVEIKIWARRIEAVGTMTIMMGSGDIALRGPLTLQGEFEVGGVVVRATYVVTDRGGPSTVTPLTFSGVALIHLPPSEKRSTIPTLKGNWMTQDLIDPSGADQPPHGTIAFGEFRVSNDLRSVSDAQSPISPPA